MPLSSSQCICNETVSVNQVLEALWRRGDCLRQAGETIARPLTGCLPVRGGGEGGDGKEHWVITPPLVLPDRLESVGTW